MFYLHVYIQIVNFDSTYPPPPWNLFYQYKEAKRQTGVASVSTVSFESVFCRFYGPNIL
jgi:hypothetical protein